MFITNDFFILVFIKYITYTFIRGFIEQTWKLWLVKKKKGKERTRKSVGLMIFIFTKQSMFFTLQTTQIELNLIINVIWFGCCQGWW